MTLVTFEETLLKITIKNMPLESLRTEKFDAIIVDCDDLAGGLQVLEGLRKVPSNRNSVTFAILNGITTTQQAFQMGVNFVLQKPISALNAARCFSAALNFMIREQRRYFRHPVEIAATLESVPETEGDNHQH
jgi:CheY-like chemotaxis protein